MMVPGSARLAARLAFGLAVSAARPAASQDQPAVPEAIPTTIAIDSADPESSIPSPEEAMRNPLEMGYLMMALSERGEAAMQKGDASAAAKYFRAIGKAVPDRAVAFRKACRAHDAAGETEQAIETCRAALGKGGVTIQDHLVFVRVVLDKKGPLGATEVGDLDAVIERLAGELGANEEGRRKLAVLRCQVGTRLEDPARLAACTQELAELEFERSGLLAYSFALALARRDLGEAGRVIAEAKRIGMPAAAVASMESGLARAELSAHGGVKGAMRVWWPAFAAALLMLLAIATVRLRRRARPTPS